MRYTRLRRQIESGTLISTHGTPFGNEKSVTVTPKRKRAASKKIIPEDEDEITPAKASLNPNGKPSGKDVKARKNPNAQKEEVGVGNGGKGKIDGGFDNSRQVNGRTDGKGSDRPGVSKTDGVIVKREEESEFESSDASSLSASEDEIPLAKLRKSRMYEGVHGSSHTHSGGAPSDVAIQDPASTGFGEAMLQRDGTLFHGGFSREMGRGGGRGSVLPYHVNGQMRAFDQGVGWESAGWMGPL